MKILDELTESGRALFNQRLVRKSFSKGSQVIDKGDSVSGAYFVLEGSLRVFTLSSEGKQATLYRMGVGDTCVLALNSLFNNVLYPAWVETDQDTTIGVVPSDAYRTLFSSEAIIQDTTMRALSSAVFGLMSELEQRHGQTLDQRLAGYLVMRASSDGKVRNTQQEIASEIGTTREVVGRLMVQFSNQGLIKTGRGVVTILNTHGLTSV